MRAHRGSVRNRETSNGRRMLHKASFVSDEHSNSPSSMGFLHLSAELRNEVYINLGLGTIIRPPKASHRRLGCCIDDYCGSNDHYSGEDFVPKDLLNLGSTCKKLCLEIRPLIFARSPLLLTTSQLCIFQASRFRHQLFDFYPWLYVYKLVLHILPFDLIPYDIVPIDMANMGTLTLPEQQERSVDEQLRILGKLDLSKIELVLLYPDCYLGEDWYSRPLISLLKPISGASNIRFESCSKYNDHGLPFTEFNEHGETFTYEGRELAKMRQMLAEMADKVTRGE